MRMIDVRLEKNRVTVLVLFEYWRIVNKWTRKKISKKNRDGFWYWRNCDMYDEQSCTCNLAFVHLNCATSVGIQHNWSVKLCVMK